MTTIEQLDAWMAGREDEHIEFKEAKRNLHFEDLLRYCVALANERGGKLVLGVTDKVPRQVVGSIAYTSLEDIEAKLFHQLHFRTQAELLKHPNGNVIIFHVPPRPTGMPIHYKGAYLMRVGEEVAPMTPDHLRIILAEGQLDFSAEICSRATLDDLDPMAIARFRSLWHRKSGNENLLQMPDEQLLRDAELIMDDGITYAALILFGSKQALGRYLAQAEVVFEYRSSEASIEFQQRIEHRQGFLLFFDELWTTINLRNDLQHFQHGMFIFDVPTFNEQVVREALLNAVSHRDYRLAGSVFVRQFPTKLEITSPGGLPEGITPDNILDRQNPRNRRIADNLVRCGLVERSGQGFDKIFGQSIREAKLLPDFTGTDDYRVHLTLHGTVRNPDFLRFLEKVSLEAQVQFSVKDLMALDFIHGNQKVPKDLAHRLPALLDAGVIESVGRGRETQYMLARNFYAFADRKGHYTRRKGLDKEQNKALILKHINTFDTGTLDEFRQVLPALSRNQVRILLQELKEAGLITFEGASPRYGSWKRS